jgi:DNA-binding MarR family transcriptional regulator
MAVATTPLAGDNRTCVGSLVVAHLTDTERRALAIVVDLDGRRSAVIVAQVAGQLGHAATAANRILRALEGRGFVVREVDDNQNAEVVFATRAGRDALDA